MSQAMKYTALAKTKSRTSEAIRRRTTWCMQRGGGGGGGGGWVSWTVVAEALEFSMIQETAFLGRSKEEGWV